MAAFQVSGRLRRSGELEVYMKQYPKKKRLQIARFGARTRK